MRRFLFAVVLLVAALPCFAQRANTFHANQFPASTQGDAIARAQAQCNASMTCVIVIDPDVAALTAGIEPAKCAKCVWVDYRGLNPFGSTYVVPCWSADFLCVNEEWINGADTIGNYKWNIFCGGTTGVSSTAGHPGFINGGTGTTINGNCNYALGANGSSGNVSDLGVYPFRLEVTAQLNSSPTNVDWYIGFKTDINTFPPTNGVYLRNQSGASSQNWECVARTAGAETSTPLPDTVLDQLWHTYAIEGDGAGNIRCFYDGVLKAVTSANIPGAAALLVPGVSIRNTVAATRVQNVDTFKLWMNLNRP